MSALSRSTWASKDEREAESSASSAKSCSSYQRETQGFSPGFSSDLLKRNEAAGRGTHDDGPFQSNEVRPDLLCARVKLERVERSARLQSGQKRCAQVGEPSVGLIEQGGHHFGEIRAETKEGRGLGWTRWSICSYHPSLYKTQDPKVPAQTLTQATLASITLARDQTTQTPMSLPSPAPPAALPPTLPPLATPPSHQISQTAFSHLLLSLPLPLLASTSVASSRRKEKERLMESEGLLPDELKEGSPAIGVTKGEDLDQTRVKQQLEALGFRVGGDLAERFVFFSPSFQTLNDERSDRTISSCGRLSFAKPRFADSLEIVKFVCKDVWMAAFNKQIDNLRTNHRVRFRLYLS